ncbi:OLC1v1007408C1 [Oldenlandia corymbosa var. corymbosa]|nr:OLC1v1007408C1 [Oldenlandia corymbosa var. corymbosa]
MASAGLGVVLEPLLKKAFALAAEEISLVWGVNKQLQKLGDKLEMIHALFTDAQNKQLVSRAVQLWLKKLQSVSLDIEIVLDDFEYEVLRQKIHRRKRDKVRSFMSSSNPILFHRKMAHNMKEILSCLEEIYVESHQIGLQPIQMINSLPVFKEKRQTDPFVEDSVILGRDIDVSKVMNMLTSLDYEKELPVIAILGMGGQGKTTLAQLVYKNDTAKSYFDKLMWLCVSDDFNVERLLCLMLQSLSKANHQLASTEALVSGLQEHLRGKRYLLVLDDIWNDNGDEWDRMRTCLLEIGGSKDSKVLTTTRSENVASAMRASKLHRLDILSEDQSWSLFEQCAFAEGGPIKTGQLMEMGKRILKRCGGVPLAIKAIGGLLYSKHSEYDWLMIARSETWSTFSEGNKVLSAIKLSYDYLPSLPVKQCFAYCAIFEKDTNLKKDQLIQLWMSQGLLNPPRGSPLRMEDIGNIYFNILLRNSLLQETREDKMDSDSNVEHFKMHDLVHDVSLQVSENYCFHIKDWKSISNELEAVHILAHFGENGMRKSLKGILPSNLRTLHAKGVNLVALANLFPNFRCLLVLIVENWDLSQLPSDIGMMKHLRYLDISHTRIDILPQSITKLYYLQTLRVFNLCQVPKGFEHLINLRRIETYNEEDLYKIFFPGLGQLRNLQKWSVFKVGGGNGGYQMEQLEHLDNLTGELKIIGLQNVRSYASAIKSNLSSKSNIETLELHWDYWRGREEGCDDAEVMEGLKPHSSLKSLGINGYQSLKFPSWMTGENDSVILQNLVKLKLGKLHKCKRLPTLGLLPHLEHLEIFSLNNVKYIGKEFYGWSNLNRATKSSRSEITLFPALRKLQLSDMKSVVKWSDAIVSHPTPQSSPLLTQVNVFPHLEELAVSDIPNLSVFPNLGNLPSLQHLRLIRIGGGNTNFGSPDERLSHSPEDPVSGSDIYQYYYYFPSLRQFWIKDCCKLSAPFCSLTPTLALVESLTIRRHQDLHHIISIRAREGFELDCFPWPYPTISTPTSNDVSLTALTLDGNGRLPKVTSLPYQIQYVTTLMRLEICGFDGLEALPEWLGNLEHLQHLRILACRNLRQLPSAEAFRRLTDLIILEIKFCPVLEKRCGRGNGSEWHKIAHLSSVHLGSL